MREKSSKYKQSNVNNRTALEGNNFSNNLPSLPYFHFSYSYLSSAGNIIVCTPNQGTNREKYFNHIIYKGKDADSGGK